MMSVGKFCVLHAIDAFIPVFVECRDLFFGIHLDAHVVIIFIDIKADQTVDDRHFRNGIDGEWVTIEDCDVSVFSFLDRSHPVLYSKLDSRVDRDKGKCLIIGEVAIFLRFCGLMVEMADQLA